MRSVKGKKLNSPNLSNIVKGTLIPKDCGRASYPCSSYRASNLLFRFNNSCKVLDLKSLWKSMKLWDLLISVMKTGGFFIRSFAKAGRDRQRGQMKNENKRFRRSLISNSEVFYISFLLWKQELSRDLHISI